MQQTQLDQRKREVVTHHVVHMLKQVGLREYDDTRFYRFYEPVIDLIGQLMQRYEIVRKEVFYPPDVPLDCFVIVWTTDDVEEKFLNMKGNGEYLGIRLEYDDMRSILCMIRDGYDRHDGVTLDVLDDAIRWYIHANIQSDEEEK